MISARLLANNRKKS